MMSDQSARDRILAEVDARRDESLQLLQDLVHFPSVNHPPGGDELQCQRFVEQWMRAQGLKVDVFAPDSIPGITEHPGWQAGRDYTHRPNVVGLRKGVGAGRSLLLLAHVDVVPEGPPALWRHGPFNPVVEGGELIGRGSNDDKGGLAALLMALRCVEAAGYRSAGDVILASVVDEESGGANGTLAVLQRGHVADGAIYCDGLDLDVHISNLGGGSGQIELQLKPEIATSGRVDQIAEIVSVFYHDLRLYGQERTDDFRRDARYTDTAWPELAVRVAELSAGSADGSNPGGARLRFYFYVLPDEDPAAVQARMAARFHSLADRYADRLQPIGLQWLGRLMPPAAISPGHPFVDVVAAAYPFATGHPARRSGMPKSDYFQFILYSPRPMPTVAIGPGRWGVLGGAHEPNESVLIDDHYLPFIKILALTILEWCGCVRDAPQA